MGAIEAIPWDKLLYIEAKEDKDSISIGSFVVIEDKRAYRLSCEGIFALV